MKTVRTVSFSTSTIERAHSVKVKPEKKPFESTESEEEDEQKQPRTYMFWPPAIGFPSFMLAQPEEKAPVEGKVLAYWQYYRLYKYETWKTKL
jgi:hypothetical protein